MNIDELERLARAATPWPWIETLEANAQAIDEQAALLIGPDRKMMKDYAATIRGAKNYIAAYSPDTILAMIERVRAAEGALVELIAAQDAGPDYAHISYSKRFARLDAAWAAARAALGRKL